METVRTTLQSGRERTMGGSRSAAWGYCGRVSRLVLLLILAASVLYGVDALCEEATFTASIDKADNTMILGDSLILELAVSCDEEPPPPQLPPVEGVNVQSLTPSRHVSSSVSMINGRTTEKKSYTVSYRYVLTPHSLGTFTIPSATLSYAGKRYETEPITVTVVKAIPQDHIIVEVVPSSRELFVGEQFRLTLKVYIDSPDRIRSHSFKIPWLTELQGFVSEDPEKFLKSLRGKYKVFVENTNIPFEGEKTTRNGKAYLMLSLGKTFFPTAIGEHRVPPCIFKCDYMTRFVEHYDLFGRRNPKPLAQETIIAASNDVVITVKPLPEEGRPAYFTGGVGQYKLEASISPSTVNAGDPVTLTARVYGYGNIDSVGWPKLENENLLRTYEGNVETHSQREGARLQGSKKFSLIVEPQSTKIDEIPRVLVAYFDPKDARYKTLTAGPFPIEVKPAQREVAVIMTPPDEEGRAAITLLKRDILPIVTSEQLLTNQSRMLYRSPFLLYTLPLPMVIAVLSVLVHRRLVRLKTDQAYARNRQAMRAAKSTLKEAKRLAAAGAQREFHAAIYRTLTEFIADKMNIPAAGVTAQTVRDLLAFKGPEEDTVKELVQCLETCEYGQFAAADRPAQRMEETLRQTAALIKKLGKTIK